jgi:DNA (cytosine-5)-methyltransferase 1
MFGLGVLRHRIFESYPVIWFPPHECNHDGNVLPMMWKSRCKALSDGKVFKYITVAGKSFLLPEAKKAMGIDWMTRKEIAQAIPPAFTEFIGRQLISQMEPAS